MGDRGNVLVKENAEDSGIYLYAHWSGTELPSIVSRALARGTTRWGDTAYLRRIIFCDMVKGEEDGETGYGIDLHEVSANHPTIVLNDSARTVTIEGDRWSYEEFARAGTSGTPLNDSAKDKARNVKCMCCR